MKTTLKQEIENFDHEVKLWQESHDSHQDGCNVTALHDLKHAQRIINQLQEIVDMQQEALKYYVDEAHWKHIYSNGSALPSDRCKLWQPAQEALEKSKQIFGE